MYESGEVYYRFSLLYGVLVVCMYIQGILLLWYPLRIPYTDDYGRFVCLFVLFFKYYLLFSCFVYWV